MFECIGDENKKMIAGLFENYHGTQTGMYRNDMWNLETKRCVKLLVRLLSFSLSLYLSISLSIYKYLYTYTYSHIYIYSYIRIDTYTYMGSVEYVWLFAVGGIVRVSVVARGLG